jgi:hypothetical protein
MTVDLTFDISIELKFLVTHQFPLSLRDAISAQKKEIHASLTPVPGDPYLLQGERSFGLDGRKFRVFFVSDRRQPSAELQPLHVTRIEKL